MFLVESYVYIQIEQRNTIREKFFLILLHSSINNNNNDEIASKTATTTPTTTITEFKMAIICSSNVKYNLLSANSELQ